MRTINDLKQGDCIYTIDSMQLKKYNYLCVHPNTPSYHIFIDDDNRQPIRLHTEYVIDTLKNKDYQTREEAMKALADSHLYLSESLRAKNTNPKQK